MAPGSFKVMRLTSVFLALSFAYVGCAVDEGPEAAQGSSGSVVASESSASDGSTSEVDPGTSSGPGSTGGSVEPDDSDEVGEGGCSTVEPPRDGFCNCEDCGAPFPIDCPPLRIRCTLEETGTTLGERCVDPVADDPAALQCILEHLAKPEPTDAVANWEVVLGREDTLYTYLSSTPILGSSSSAWGFATDPPSWSTDGVVGEAGLQDEAGDCLALPPEDQPACLHDLLNLFEPESCFEPVPEVCA